MSESRYEYSRRHYLVKKERGLASDYLCAGCCGSKALDWATIHGRSGLDIWLDYVPVCRKCHTEYDDKPARISESKRGVARSPEATEKIRQAQIGGKRSSETRAKMARSRRKISKLTWEDVQIIRAAVAGGTTQTEMAKRYGVTKKAISKIINRESWISE